MKRPVTEAETKAKIAQEFRDEIMRLADENMRKTGVLAGAHFNAMETILKRWKSEAGT